MNDELQLLEPESRFAEVLEMYVPKRAAYISKLYEFLSDAIKPMLDATITPPNVRLQGYSVYEVDGAYAGSDRTYEERVLVVRLVFPQGETIKHPSVRMLADELARITARGEEEIWIVQYASASVFSITNKSATATT